MILTKKAAYLAGLSALLVASATHAKELRNGVTVTPTLGYYMYDSALQFDDHEVYGGALGYQFANGFELGINYFTGSTTFTNTDYELDMEQGYLTGAFHFKYQEPSHPYILIGGGRQSYKSGPADYQDSVAIAGAGYQLALSRSVSLRPDVRALYNLDEQTGGVGFMLGISWRLGGSSTPDKPKPPVKPIIIDTDNDGIIDSQDQCPNTLAGQEVDSQGCKVNKDVDNDGVPNDRDKCPDTSESAKVDQDGCYIVITEALEVQLYVTFEGGSSTVAATSYDEIREVADFMKEYPLTRVVLAGHTDSTGSAQFNQTLSLRRAQAVANLLNQYFGIDYRRIETVGYGETNPLYPNDTPANRAANRRVTATVTALVETIQK